MDFRLKLKPKASIFLMLLSEIIVLKRIFRLVFFRFCIKKLPNNEKYQQKLQKIYSLKYREIAFSLPLLTLIPRITSYSFTAILCSEIKTSSHGNFSLQLYLKYLVGVSACDTFGNTVFFSDLNWLNEKVCLELKPWENEKKWRNVENIDLPW